jgi:hypothetical protein
MKYEVYCACGCKYESELTIMHSMNYYRHVSLKKCPDCSCDDKIIGFRGHSKDK